MKKAIQIYLPLLLIAGAIILLDQYTKAVVRQNLAFQETWMPWTWLAPYARIVHWYNTGVAFGMFQNGNTVFAILAMFVSAAILVIYPRIPREETIIRIATAMMLGGAVGNLIDRLTVKHVTDFISLGSFAVFNIADMSITCGVGVLLLGVWLEERRSRGKKSDQGPANLEETSEKTQ